jgi:DNA-binding NarL/FixJ family response regulator
MANPGHKPGVLEAAVAAFNKTGSITEAARELKLSPHTVDSQLESARRLGMNVLPRARDKMATPDAKGRIETDLENGVVFVGSDLHAWPGVASTAHRAFVHLCKEHTPDIVIMNGDATDLPRVSRHPPPGWTRMPEVKDEIEVTAERLGEIMFAAPKAKRYWPWGNHDQRFEVYLATKAAEIAGVFGTRLLDHFPDWEPCWSVFINNRPGGLVVKHRLGGGIGAPRANAMKAGRSIPKKSPHTQRIMARSMA